MRDVLLIARFELLRAIRTWRALALLAMYAAATGFASRIFVEAIGAMESALARMLQVPRTETPGAMLNELVTSSIWRDAVLRFTHSERLTDHLVTVPPMALFWLWVGFVLTPFFAASTAAECVAIDASTKALRYELLRTGRLELVMGRFLGQVVGSALGTVVSAVVLFATAWWSLSNQSPWDLIGALGAYLPRAIAWGVPYVGVGVAASLSTTSAAWARVLALGGVVGSWVAFGVATELSEDYPWVGSLVLPLVPQGWMRGLWEPGFGWVGSATALVALGVAAVAVGWPLFARKQL